MFLLITHERLLIDNHKNDFGLGWVGLGLMTLGWNMVCQTLV